MSFSGPPIFRCHCSISLSQVHGYPIPSVLSLEFLSKPLGQPDAGKRGGVGRALARQPAQHGLHRWRNPHIELRRVFLKQRLVQDPVKIAVVLYDL